MVAVQSPAEKTILKKQMSKIQTTDADIPKGIQELLSNGVVMMKR